jgi:hypothetical protein
LNEQIPFAFRLSNQKATEKGHSSMSDNELARLVARLRQRYQFLESLDLELSIEEAAEFKVLGEIISLLEDAVLSKQSSKH